MRRGIVGGPPPHRAELALEVYRPPGLRPPLIAAQPSRRAHEFRHDNDRHVGGASRCLRLVNVSGGALEVSMVRRSRSVSLHQRKLLRSRARRMRQALRRSQLGVSFRRQVVLRGYIAIITRARRT